MFLCFKNDKCIKTFILWFRSFQKGVIKLRTEFTDYVVLWNGRNKMISMLNVNLLREPSKELPVMCYHVAS